MKRILCIFLCLITAALCCSCAAKSNSASDTGQLTYYYVKDHRDDMVEKIQRYNRWCYTHSTDDMRIKLIEFDSYETMSRRLNLEVMSGGGPDLFSNYMDLPFEKLLQSGAFYDLNKLIENDTSDDKIDLSLYNDTIMDAGVYNGKRYFIPAFYRVQSLVGERQDFEKFDMPTDQGHHLTFGNMDEVFGRYLEDPGSYAFMAGDVYSGGFNADTAVLRLVNSYVDFEKETVSFDDDFKTKLQFLSRLRENAVAAPEKASSGIGSSAPVLFHQEASYSNPIWTEFMLSLPDEDFVREKLKLAPMDDPVMYSCFEKDDDTFSANIVDALFVNAETKKADKVLAFIKYLLGSHIQNLYTGTNEDYNYGGDVDFLPVLKSAFQNCVRDSHTAGKWFGEEVSPSLHPLTQALVEHVNQINTVYLYFDLYESNYNKNVVIPILQDYWDGKTDINKCVNNLSSATKIYIME